MSLWTTSTSSISNCSNIDALLLRSFRVLRGEVEGELPPYLDIASVDRVDSLPSVPSEGSSISGYGYFLSVTAPEENCFPYLIFRSPGTCRLLNSVKSLEVRDNGLYLWSYSNMLDTDVSVDVYWVRKLLNVSSEINALKGMISALEDRVSALEQQNSPEEGTDDI